MLLVISWRKQTIDFVRSYWMPVSAFIGIPFVALANKYRKADIDFTFLHAVDVANLSFSLWGSFLVSYFVVYCGEHVWMRMIAFYIGGRIDRRANKFLDSGLMKDPWSIVRYYDATDRLKLEWSEAYRRVKINYFAYSAWALFIMWTGIWNLTWGSLFLVGIICYGLFKFDDEIRRLRDQTSRMSYRYRVAIATFGTREERIEHYQKRMQEIEDGPKTPWPRVFYRMAKDIPNVLSFNVDWHSNHSKVTAAVCILIIALHFGNALAKAAEDGPDRLFRVADQELCGKLLVQSYYGFHISVTPDERIVYLPEVDAIEDLARGTTCVTTEDNDHE